MITTKHIINLLLQGYHNGRYLNGHPEIARSLSLEMEHTDSEYYIECVEGWDKVRVWSSLSAYQADKQKRISSSSETINQPNPLTTELREAIMNEDWERVVQIRTRMNEIGVSK